MSKPARAAISADAHELVAHPVHVGAVHRASAPGCAATTALGDGAITGQLPASSGASHLLPAELRRALGAGMAELHADLRVGLGMDEIDDALPGRLVLGRIEARCSRA